MWNKDSSSSVLLLLLQIWIYLYGTRVSSTENSLLHVFSFLHKLSFKNSICFLSIFSCQTSFLVSKIENCFWKQKIKEKNSYQTYLNILCVNCARGLDLNLIITVTTHQQYLLCHEIWDFKGTKHFKYFRYSNLIFCGFS